MIRNAYKRDPLVDLILVDAELEELRDKILEEYKKDAEERESNPNKETNKRVLELLDQEIRLEHKKETLEAERESLKNRKPTNKKTSTVKVLPKRGLKPKRRLKK